MGYAHYPHPYHPEQTVTLLLSHLLVQFKVIPIHNGQLKYFQKITRPDTITEASLHKVWYSKSNNQVEFFTADGENPEDNQLLKQLSIHKYNQYIMNY